MPGTTAGHSLPPDRGGEACWRRSHDQHSDRTAADAGCGRRSAQLHQGRPVARRDAAGRQRADQAAARPARNRSAGQERARREPDLCRRTGGQLCAAAAVDQRSDSRYRRAAPGGEDHADRRNRRFHRVRHRARADLLRGCGGPICASSVYSAYIDALLRDLREGDGDLARLGLRHRSGDRHQALLDRGVGVGALAVDARSNRADRCRWSPTARSACSPAMP